MPRGLWFLPIITITALGGLWAFRMGWMAATITETDAINTYAQQYLAAEGSGARPNDCEARPGQTPAVWIVVTCTADSTRRYHYVVNRLGGLVEPDSLRALPESPET